MSTTNSPLIDPFGRAITYLRVSVTDRCDFRCSYCMAEHMTFLPKKELLTLEELDRLCAAFIRFGVRKIRLTGGEPLVRKGIMSLVTSLGQRLNKDGAGVGLDELTLTTNASQLARFAKDLKSAGVRRINISLDTLDEDRFTALTRGGRLPMVLKGIDAALASGLELKINTVALRGINDSEIPFLMEWCHERGMVHTLIEAMPVGETPDRFEQFLPLDAVRAQLEQRYTLTPSVMRTGGPARYVDVAETGGKLGLITPLTGNFCEGCNRVRVTCTGTLYMCLGQEDARDLRAPIRDSEADDLLEAAIIEAIGRKPASHEFEQSQRQRNSAVGRHMNVTGG